VEIDSSTWTSMCDSGTGNSPLGATSHESCPLACLLEHPSWRLAGSVKVDVANGLTAVKRQRGGGERGRLGLVGNAMRRRQREGGRRGWGVVRRGGTTGDRRWRGEVGWADGHDDAGMKRSGEHQDARTGRVDRVTGRATRAEVSVGRLPSVWMS
jgi:hypothetical protein